MPFYNNYLQTTPKTFRCKKKCKMKSSKIFKSSFTTGLAILIVLTNASKFCEDNPKLIQCIATRNQFVLPEREYCNPYQNSCRTGDLIDTRVATCEPKFTSHIRQKLIAGFKESKIYRCFPTLETPAAMNHRAVGPSYGQPQCSPVDFRYGEGTGEHEGDKIPGTFVCGELGTRCVCSAPAEKNGVGVWNNNECRCQYFVDLCKIENLCTSTHANCKMWGSEVQCVCPAENKKCSLGINQCKANPSLCENVGRICVELSDHNPHWTLGGEKDGDGFACMTSNTIEQLKLTTHYCEVTKEIFDGELNSKPTNDVDECCYRMLTCAGRITFPPKGGIYSYRRCYCNVEFRRCLLKLIHNPKYKSAAQEMARAIDNVTDCVMDEGQRCDPTKPKTCSKGDLISPNVAHCKVDCKTGPLLPIWARACSIRQCKPPSHQPYIRVIDVPDQEETSICRPVDKLPVLCEKAGTNTRCVCDGKPLGNAFTDRCRCQYWPLRWSGNSEQ